MSTETRTRRVVDNESAHAHFITITCSGRRKLLSQDRCKRIIISKLETTRRDYRGICFGFVIMPEHAHVLVRFPVDGTLQVFKQEWKRQTSEALIGYFERTDNPVLQHITDDDDGYHQVWIPKQHDLNVWSEGKAFEKLEYMHDNPVRRDLCAKQEDWQYSSARWYLLKKSVGVSLTSVIE